MKTPRDHTLNRLLLCAVLLGVGCDTASQSEATPEASVTEKSAPAKSAAAADAKPVDPQAQAAANAAVERVDVKSLTTAPMQAKVTARLDAAPAEVWAYVSDNKNLEEYGAALGVEAVKLDTSNATADGVGVVRECSAMGGKSFRERVVYADPPYVFGYAAFENPLGLDDHLGLVIVRPAADGKTELEWRQYFNPADPEAGGSMEMKAKMMTAGLVAFFTKKYGGEVVT